MNFNSNDQLFAFLIYFSILAIYVKSDSHGPLNFDRNTGTLVDMKTKIQNSEGEIGHKLAIACPAKSPSEKHFNSEHSFGKNSLFVTDTYEGTAPPSSVPQDICAEVYKLSIIYNRRNEEFQLGYEVYYDLKKYGPFKYYSYADFDTVANAYSTNSKKPTLLNKLRHSKLKLELKDDGGKIIKKIKLGFLWIPVTRFKFDNLKKTPTEVIYVLSKATEVGAHCKDYGLGGEIYKQDIDFFYNSQINTFNNVEIPEADRGCETENKCFTKYSLVPAEEFRFRSPEPMDISCSNLTTVPIWKRGIHGALQKLDKFLYALAKFAHGTLTVFSGVHGQLGMKNEHQETTKIFLDGENEIPVPDIVYKIVKYDFIAPQSTFGFNDDDAYELAYVIIVFHNDPQFDLKDALCEANNCETWGWGEILNGATSSSESPLNNIYCCPGNEEILQKLGIKYKSAFSKELNLKKFPTFDYNYNERGITNIEQDVKDLLKERSDLEEAAQNEKV